MKKLKDFFYNKNDIIIVLIILAVAALIIYTRIGAIMDYPAKLAKQAAATAETTTTEPASAEKEKISVIYDAGLISSKSEFEEYITGSGKESSIKAGTYEIPISSLQEEILNIITE